MLESDPQSQKIRTALACFVEKIAVWLLNVFETWCFSLMVNFTKQILMQQNLQIYEDVPKNDA